MSEHLDRDEIVQLLDVLGDEDDAEVLAAARQLHAKIAAAGVDWDELLLASGDDQSADFTDDADNQDDTDQSDDGSSTAKNGRDQTTLDLIAKLLSRPNCSDALREELEEYKTDIAEGEFEARDHEYVRALHKRLTK